MGGVLLVGMCVTAPGMGLVCAADADKRYGFLRFHAGRSFCVSLLGGCSDLFSLWDLQASYIVILKCQ